MGPELQIRVLPPYEQNAAALMTLLEGDAAVSAVYPITYGLCKHVPTGGIDEIGVDVFLVGLDLSVCETQTAIEEISRIEGVRYA